MTVTTKQLRPANTFALNTGCLHKNLYLPTIRHRWFDLVITLIMYLLISRGYHDLQMRNWVVIFCKVMTTTNFENTTDNEYIKSQQLCLLMCPLEALFFPYNWLKEALIYIITAWLINFNFQYLPCVLPPALLLHISCMIFSIFYSFNITTC